MTEEQKKKMGRPKVYDKPRVKMSGFIEVISKGRMDRLRKKYNQPEGKVLELLLAYTCREPKVFDAFARVFFERGDLYALGVDGRVKIQKLINPTRK